MAEYEKAPHTPTTDDANILLKGDIETQSPVAESRSQDDNVLEDPHRRGLRWWKKRLGSAVPVGLWPRLLYCVIGIVCLTIWLAIMLALADTAPQIGVGDYDLATAINSDGSSREFIFLEGSLVNFNTEKRILTISWLGFPSPYLWGEVTQFGDIDDPHSPKMREGIEIYRDVSSERYNATYTSADNVTKWEWTYQIDNRTAKPIGVIGMHPWDGFDTDIAFTQKERKSWRQPLFGYPFDLWHGEVVLVANNVTQSNRFNVNGTGVTEIAGIDLTDHALNWVFIPEVNNTCAGNDRLATLDFGTLDENTLPPSCHIKIVFRGMRPLVVIICAITAVAVNWTCAIFIFVLTCETVFMRRSYMLQGTDILSMCFTALFALPTIRLLLPGAPDYGVMIDLIGVLPCTLIVALCTVCISIVKLRLRRMAQKEE
ncbi:hypothetical protein FRB91_000797 [Serendipita sp. 411]|nr:hypothetical protein FRC16_004493 [Serendipita sp. 398]KAG8817825.1 hypothetical protein FRC19_011123 [Serendipita sp. 401]KAG8819957.1 hypothetical protein FRC18_011881 [Serendipita sp. 400]KAG8846439.1 hypothetical protein FRB91_000797 [Serendipita sp. 411]KAG9041956.1 hypothetical protein FS842_002377 [Serendipita sp. 407]